MIEKTIKQASNMHGKGKITVTFCRVYREYLVLGDYEKSLNNLLICTLTKKDNAFEQNQKKISNQLLVSYNKTPKNASSKRVNHRTSEHCSK